jgi:hypothetical protein
VFFFIADSEGTGGSYEEKRLKLTIIGAEANGRKTTLGEIYVDLGQHVGCIKKDLKLKSKLKLNKKIGEKVNLAFDLTILKPADYIREAEKEEKRILELQQQ